MDAVCPHVHAVESGRHLVVSPLPFKTVMVLQDRHTNGSRIPFFSQCIDEDQVAKRLRHLGTIHKDHGNVHPMLDKRSASRRFTLSPFTFVMRENEVASATM